LHEAAVTLLNRRSNQALQPTAARPDTSVSIHESAFTPSMPRPRQR